MFIQMNPVARPPLSLMRATVQTTAAWDRNLSLADLPVGVFASFSSRENVAVPSVADGQGAGFFPSEKTFASGRLIDSPVPDLLPISPLSLSAFCKMPGKRFESLYAVSKQPLTTLLTTL